MSTLEDCLGLLTLKEWHCAQNCWLQRNKATPDLVFYELTTKGLNDVRIAAGNTVILPADAVRRVSFFSSFLLEDWRTLFSVDGPAYEGPTSKPV